MRRRKLTTRAIAAIGGALVLAAGVATAAVAAPAHPAAQPNAPQHPANAPLVAAFEQLSQNNQWTLSKTIPDTWTPAGEDWEQEGFKYYGGRYYISVYDHTNNDGHLVILNGDGSVAKIVTFVDGNRTHAGGIDVYGNYAYVPLAVDAPDSSADILQINVHTYQVKTLFTVGYDHVGGIDYDPATHLLIGQDWDSRHFYEWTLSGKIVAQWNNPSDYVAYQDCQYVVYNKLLCSGSNEDNTTIGGFDLIDLSDPEHAILNGVPNPNAGNANEILATQVPNGTELTDYDAGGDIDEYTTFIPNPGYVPPAVLSVPEGTPTLDDQEDAVWDNSPTIHISGSDSPISANVQMLWDDNYLYVLANIADDTPNATVTSTGEPGNSGIGLDDDSIDIWINWEDSSSASYYATSGSDLAAHYDITRNGIVASDYPDVPNEPGYGSSDPSTVKSDVTSSSTGYVVEAAIPWPASIGPQPEIGINFSVNDVSTPGGSRSSYITWEDSTEYWDTPVGMPGVDLVSS